jgi:hypothetical protein
MSESPKAVHGAVAVPPNSPDEFAKFIAENIDKWTKVINSRASSRSDLGHALVGMVLRALPSDCAVEGLNAGKGTCADLICLAAGQQPSAPSGAAFRSTPLMAQRARVLPQMLY